MTDFRGMAAMLLLGATGMLLGLAVDAHSTGLAALASICSQAQGALLPMMRLHWELLPWMHVGMWAGGFAAIPLLRHAGPGRGKQYCARVVQNLACSAWMTVGMSAGALLTAALAPQGPQPGPASMLAGMFGGMVWGMVASVLVRDLVPKELNGLALAWAVFLRWLRGPFGGKAR